MCPASRRHVLATIGAATLAGCGSSQESSGDGNEEESSDGGNEEDGPVPVGTGDWIPEAFQSSHVVVTDGPALHGGPWEDLQAHLTQTRQGVATRVDHPVTMEAGTITAEGIDIERVLDVTLDEQTHHVYLGAFDVETALATLGVEDTTTVDGFEVGFRGSSHLLWPRRRWS